MAHRITGGRKDESLLRISLYAIYLYCWFYARAYNRLTPKSVLMKVRNYERKDQAEIQRRRLMGITEQKVCLNAPLRRDAIKRSRSRGWKWQQEKHRCVLHVCL